MSKIYNVLFLCTGNSARSILAESILNQLGRGKFKAFSAGSFPTGEVNPYAIQQLRDSNLPTEDLRSKSWDEFSKPDSPKMDFVFTVCDNAKNEVCPVWIGQPMTAHWGISDPASVEGSDEDKKQAFQKAFRILSQRINIFINLRFDLLDNLKIQENLNLIGQS